MTRNRKWKKAVKTVLFFGAIVLCHYTGDAQIDELANKVAEARSGANTIGNDFISIVRICAAVLVGILALSFLIIRENNGDMAKKIGNFIIGLAIFYVLLEIANSLA